ncbi:MAG: 3(2), 5-bisphosphate nucleotidase [Candidatus Eremiobacteraeota bacterium]|nr:3(2), 5-bisphosphate nucleotidase [Candidatus Eremiobacteraeota bacterium]
MLDEVLALARRAGDAILAVVAARAHAPTLKADDSPVTAADLAADRVIAAGLAALDPLTPLVSEEQERVHDGTLARFWLVDPLDGTREFVRGGDDYTVNIALVEDGVPVLGVVHVPATGVSYAAARGAGATRVEDGESRPIAARRAGAQDELVVVASRSHRNDALEAFLGALPPHRAISIGSSLKLCLVAEGAADLYPRTGPTSWWDTAAAHAVALEAGAEVVTLDGAPLRYAGPSILNPWFVCSALPRAVWAAAADAVAGLQRT